MFNSSNIKKNILNFIYILIIGFLVYVIWYFINISAFDKIYKPKIDKRVANTYKVMEYNTRKGFIETIKCVMTNKKDLLIIDRKIHALSKQRVKQLNNEMVYLQKLLIQLKNKDKVPAKLYKEIEKYTKEN